MERQVAAGTPFFMYYPITQIHFPTLPHPDFAGTTGAGDIGDAMASIDYNVGLVLDALERLGVADNTIVFWCTDNGAELRRPWRGSSGPWRGFYNTVMEGGIRTPCVIRWSDRIPPGQVTNEIIHQVDFFPTLAAAVGRADMVPTDRPIDGVNQLPFFEGLQAHSNRESVVWMAQGGQVRAVKWRNWKLHYAYRPEPDEVNQSTMQLFNLLADPKEETDVKDVFPWVKSVADGIVAEYEESVARYPNVPTTATDPYTPPWSNR
jgi:arylsulfatase A-like enzyme